MNEFDIIAKFFAPLGKDGFKDDAAVLQIPPGHELVVTSDTLNEGTHFWVNEAAEFIAHKALRVNLSDLAAMGAEPLCYQLNIAYPQKPEALWLEKFTDALAADQKEFGIFCSGGDTTSINGPLSISIAALGLVPSGRAVKRSGAKAGDAVVLTGPVGDAWIGLEILRGHIKPENPQPFLEACRKPVPQTKIAASVRAYANAAADVSDGLIADLMHIAKASNLAAVIEADKIPVSPEAAKLAKLEDLVSGGDDYQLVLAVPPDNLAALDFPHHVIGRFEAGPPTLHFEGPALALKQTGWSHF